MKRIFLLLLPVFSVNASIYECDINGIKTYQQNQCPADAKNIKPPINQAPASLPLHENTTKKQPSKKNYEQELIEITIYRLERRIKKSLNNINRLKNKMRREVDTLKAKTYRAANNLSGAIYRDSLSTEMIAVTNKYTIMIKAEESNIEKTKVDIAALK